MRDLAAGGVSVVDMGEVLVIKRVSMEMGGKYTCVTADGQRLDAHVTVVGEFNWKICSCPVADLGFHEGGFIR